MDSLSYLQHDVSAVFDNPCGNIKEPVSQCLDELLLIYAGQCQPFDPVDNVIGQHPDGQICPIGMELLTGESVEGKTRKYFKGR
jgi:hypothetical protein